MSTPDTLASAAAELRPGRQADEPAGAIAAALQPPRRFVVPDGTLEMLKWIALLAMVADHINKYLLGAAYPAFFLAGRLSLPIFGFVLAYNMARPSVDADARHRTLKRMTVVALIASLPYMALGGLLQYWWPLNIMFTLALGVAIIGILESDQPGRAVYAVLAFVVGGFFVEYWWPGIGTVLAAWAYVRRPSFPRLALWAFTLSMLLVPVWFVSGARSPMNAWALMAIPLLFLARYVDFDFPRWRWAFYVAFPAQYLVIWLLRMSFGFK